MSMSLKQIIFSASVLFLFAASASADSLVYVVSANPNTGAGEFGTVNLSTGAFQPIWSGRAEWLFRHRSGTEWIARFADLYWPSGFDRPCNRNPNRYRPKRLGTLPLSALRTDLSVHSWRL